MKIEEAMYIFRITGLLPDNSWYVDYYSTSVTDKEDMTETLEKLKAWYVDYHNLTQISITYRIDK